MSEYQFIDFAAVDGPVSPKNLDFMRKQSTRAEISEWRFTNQYEYGDFHGDAKAMLRRGYDVHLHYANFGIRTLMFRLPDGLPCDKRVFNDYAIEGCLFWDRDQRGPGGILTIQPEGDAGTWDEYQDVESLLDELMPLREAFMGGDLRLLFVAWLGCCYDVDAKVPPIPAGLKTLTPPLKTLADFFEIPPTLMSRVGRDSAPAPPAIDQSLTIKQWVARQSKAELQEIVAQFLASDPTVARAKIMAEIRGAHSPPTWPTTSSTATYGELCEAKR